MALIQINALRALGKLDEARALVVAAFRKAEGNKRQTAAELGCNPATLYRLISMLELWDALDAIRVAEGWRDRSGRTRTAYTLTCLLAAALACGMNACASDIEPTEPAVAYDGAADGGTSDAVDTGDASDLTHANDGTDATTHHQTTPISPPSAAGSAAPAVDASAPSADAGSALDADATDAADANVAADSGSPADAGAQSDATAPSDPTPVAELVACRLPSGSMVYRCDDATFHFREYDDVSWEIVDPTTGARSQYYCASGHRPALGTPACVVGDPCWVDHGNAAGITSPEQGVCQ